jgi:hypothetical protein
MVDLSRVEIVFKNPLQLMQVAAPPAGKQLLTVTFEQFTITAEGDHVMYTLPVEFSVRMQVGYVDANGNKAKVDGEVSWETSDDTMLTVEVDPVDSTVCRVRAVGAAGQAQVQATADADLGDGVRELITLCDIEVVAGEAVAGMIQPLGAPEGPHPDQQPVPQPEPR